MKFRILNSKFQICCLLLLACQLPLSAEQIKPAWSVDISDNMLRLRARNVAALGAWGELLFVGPDKIAFYYLRPAGPGQEEPTNPVARFYVQAFFYDAHDGHEIKSLNVPASYQNGVLMATQEGRFIVRAGDMLRLYSKDFEPLASRQLPSLTHSPAEWRSDVTASGAEVVLAHSIPLQRTSEISPAVATEVVILDSDTLQIRQRFTVPHLAAWSAGDGFLLTRDPRRTDEEGPVGLLRFDGQWSPVKTSMDRCHPSIVSYPRSRLLAIGPACNKLMLLSSEGREQRSIKISSKLQAIAASDGYLATSTLDILPFDPLQPLGAAIIQRLEVHDMTTINAGSWQLMLGGIKPLMALSARGDVVTIQAGTLEFFQSRVKANVSGK